MRGTFTQSSNPYSIYCLVYTLANEGERQATHSQRPGHIILYHGGDNLIIWVLKNHADTITNSLLLLCIFCINASNQHLTALWQQQGIAMARQRRFTAPI